MIRPCEGKGPPFLCVQTQSLLGEDSSWVKTHLGCLLRLQCSGCRPCAPPADRSSSPRSALSLPMSPSSSLGSDVGFCLHRYELPGVLPLGQSHPGMSFPIHSSAGSHKQTSGHATPTQTASAFAGVWGTRMTLLLFKVKLWKTETQRFFFPPPPHFL